MKLPEQSSPLPLKFYQRDTVTVAKDLLGKGLFVRKNSSRFLCEIVEVEAYLGKHDEATIAFEVRPQETNRCFKSEERLTFISFMVFIFV